MWEVANPYSGEVRSETFKTKREALQFLRDIHLVEKPLKSTHIGRGTYSLNFRGCDGHERDYVVFNTGDGRAW